MTDARLNHDGRSITVRVPMAFAKRGGRKLVISPDGVATVPSSRPRIDNTMVKALARAFRWRKLLETGVFVTVEEIAAAEKINPSYVSRILRLTLLAPDLVEAILDGRHPSAMTLAVLMRPFAMGWEHQLAVGFWAPRRGPKMGHSPPIVATSRKQLGIVLGGTE